MFQWLSGSRRRARLETVDALYEQIVAAARRAHFYSEWKVPDTPLGRFEVLSLHLFLFLHRLRGEEGALRDIAQEVTDTFFREVDHSLRELGVGDLGVPKRMKKLARMFYGRLASYGEAVEAGDRVALSAAVQRNIVPDRAVWDEASELAEYLLKANAELAKVGEDALLAGNLYFAPLPQEHDRHGP
ncbi:ubiquinol-cytochrome C chaperone family protein [Chelativorans sp. YIM 93263]|uniref:ubiquinol-cytochrome C chaperone family protein n=1 Tax=Chelativorans sp. YIM 93263 TaxID=2906648 RepID=UPI0023793F3A|nr:ubiquinol-cytochrome C chaperone family protein [Chelativorans sp. YIM 93263]